MTHSTHPNTPESAYTILAIDDDAYNLYLVKSALTPEFTVLTAESGAKGLSIAEKHPIDLIILDLMMPDMNGYETLRHFKAMPHQRETPVILFSALQWDSAAQIGLEMGAAEYITKPCDLENLRQTVRRLLQTTATPA